MVRAGPKCRSPTRSRTTTARRSTSGSRSVATRRRAAAPFCKAEGLTIHQPRASEERAPPWVTPRNETPKPCKGGTPRCAEPVARLFRPVGAWMCVLAETWGDARASLAPGWLVAGPLALQNTGRRPAHRPHRRCATRARVVPGSSTLQIQGKRFGMSRERGPRGRWARGKHRSLLFR